MTYTLGGGRGWPKSRNSKGGCVNLVHWSWPKYRRGGRWSEMLKFVLTLWPLKPISQTLKSYTLPFRQRNHSPIFHSKHRRLPKPSLEAHDFPHWNNQTVGAKLSFQCAAEVDQTRHLDQVATFNKGAWVSCTSQSSKRGFRLGSRCSWSF